MVLAHGRCSLVVFIRFYLLLGGRLESLMATPWLLPDYCLTLAC